MLKYIMGAGVRFAGLGMIQKVLIGIAVAAVLGFVAWAFRVDSLRARHLESLSLIIQPLEKANGVKVGTIKSKNAPAYVKRLATSRDEWKDSGLQWRRERDNARGVVEEQSQSIAKFNRETVRLRRISQEEAKKVAALTQERNFWVAEAERAATREERLICEEELAETERALDALFEKSF